MLNIKEYTLHNAHKRMDGVSGKFPVKSINERNNASKSG